MFHVALENGISTSDNSLLVYKVLLGFVCWFLCLISLFLVHDHKHWTLQGYLFLKIMSSESCNNLTSPFLAFYLVPPSIQDFSVLFQMGLLLMAESLWTNRLFILFIYLPNRLFIFGFYQVLPQHRHLKSHSVETPGSLLSLAPRVLRAQWVESCAVETGLLMSLGWLPVLQEV